VQLPTPFTAGQAVHALRQVVRVASGGNGAVLIFDGLERMDLATVDAFRELVTQASTRELTVGFTQKDLGADRLGDAPAMELNPLSAEETAKWAVENVEGIPSRGLLGALLERTRGLPALLNDWLCYLDDRGLLRASGGADAIVELDGEAPRLDDDALAEARVQAMPPEARRVMEAALVCGDGFDAAQVALALPGATQPVFVRAVLSRMIRPLAGRRWGFVTARQQAALARAPLPERPAMHLRLALALIEQGKATPGAVDPVVVARHLTAAGSGTRAVVLWKHACEQALARRAPRDAVVALRGWVEALGLVPHAPPELLRARIDALARGAGLALTMSDAGLARQLVDEGAAILEGQTIASPELQLSLARVHRSEARRSRATEALARAEQLAAGGPVVALIEAERAEKCELEGDLAGAIAAWEKALVHAPAGQELAGWHGEIDLTARLQARLAAACLLRKDPARARQLFETSLVTWRTAGWPHAEARVLSNLGTLLAQQKDGEGAAKYFHAAAQAAERGGDLMFQARALLQAAKAHKLGRAAEAKAPATQAKALAQAIGWADGAAQADALLR